VHTSSAHFQKEAADSASIRTVRCPERAGEDTMDSEPGELVVRIVGAENVGRSHTIYIGITRPGSGGVLPSSHQRRIPISASQSMAGWRQRRRPACSATARVDHPGDVRTEALSLSAVQCSAGVARWEVRKRFSDFVQLHASLKTRQQAVPSRATSSTQPRRHCTPPPPLPLCPSGS
jgi:hypothetical protein